MFLSVCCILLRVRCWVLGAFLEYFLTCITFLLVTIGTESLVGRDVDSLWGSGSFCRWAKVNNILNEHLLHCHYRHLLHTRKRSSLGGAMPPTASADVHDSHKYSVHTSLTAPTLHFHLAASINSNTGQCHHTCVYLATVSFIVFCCCQQVSYFLMYLLAHLIPSLASRYMFFTIMAFIVCSLSHCCCGMHKKIQLTNLIGSDIDSSLVLCSFCCYYCQPLFQLHFFPKYTLCYAWYVKSLDFLKQTFWRYWQFWYFGAWSNLILLYQQSQKTLKECSNLTPLLNDSLRELLSSSYCFLCLALCYISHLLTYFLTCLLFCLLIYFLTIDPFRCHAGGRKRRPNLALVCCVYFVF